MSEESIGSLSSAPCPVCGSPTVAAGRRHSTFSGRDFELAHCLSCHFGFVTAPRTDFDKIYDEAYYRGEGADPHVAYEAGASGTDTVQAYEWRGIVRVLRDAGALAPGDRWLDYGCGLGGLVSYGRRLGHDVVGYDEGYAAGRLLELAIPSLSTSELEAAEQTFDVITAIEVLEHLVDPVETLGRMARLLKPGGLLFVTTGNAKPYRGRLDRWQYVRPDIHIGFFEPDTLRTAYERVGLVPTTLPYGPGFSDLVRSKVLRTVNMHQPNRLERVVPWSIASRLVDRRFGVSAQPAARRPS